MHDGRRLPGGSFRSWRPVNITSLTVCAGEGMHRTSLSTSFVIRTSAPGRALTPPRAVFVTALSTALRPLRRMNRSAFRTKYTVTRRSTMPSQRHMSHVPVGKTFQKSPKSRDDTPGPRDPRDPGREGGPGVHSTVHRCDLRCLLPSPAVLASLLLCAVSALTRCYHCSEPRLQDS